MTGQQSDAAVARTGDGRAGGKTLLDRAVVAYYEDMRGAVRRRGLEPALATEVVHDLYIQLSRKPDCLDGKTSWRAFLIRAAVNLGIDRLRRMSFEKRLFALLDRETATLPADTVPMERRIDAARRLERLKAAVAELPRQCRAVFIAYHIAGLSKDDITQGLGMKRRMVDRHLRNALLHCLDRLDLLD